MSTTCKFCGTEIEGNVTECPLCHTPVEKTEAAAVPEPKTEPANEERPSAPAASPAAGKYICTGCGKEYPAGTKFCSECGGKVEEKKPVIVRENTASKYVCTGCGKEYPAGTKFCSECGGKVEEKKPEPVGFVCSQCGKIYDSPLKFCSECGGKVEAAGAAKKIVCLQCGKEYPAGTKFCSECGGKVGEKDAAAPGKAENKRAAWIAKVSSDDDDVREAVEYLKTADLEYPSVKDAVMAARCADLQALQTIHKNGFAKWNDPEIMLAAAQTPFVENIQFIHEHGGDVNAKDKEDGETALQSASSEGYLEVVKYLVSQGADVNAEEDNYGRTALIKASGSGHLDIVKFLVTQGANVDPEEDNYPTALIDASRCGHLEIVKYLVSQGANVNAKNNYSVTALVYAAAQNHLDVVKYLVSQGADVNGEDILTNSSSNLDIVKYLVSQGADVNTTNESGETALMRASGGGHLEVVKYLVSQGAQVNAWDYNCRTALMHALGMEQLEVIKYLISNMDVNDALIQASSEGHLEFVKYLVSHGADVNTAVDDGLTALMIASTEGHLEVVKYLVNQGADVNAVDDEGVNTPLSCAIHNHNEDCADFLRQHGAVAVGANEDEDEETAAEIAERYFQSSKMKFSSAEINFAPDFPMCATLPQEGTIAIVSDTYHVVSINKSGVHIRPKQDGSGAVSRFFSNLFDGKVQPVDLIWQDITSVVYTHDVPGRYDTIDINDARIWLGEDKAMGQFAEDLRNYARERGAKL